ncbi:MAG: hypothetical protein AVDCRST_MAG64-2625, partial [uncultured Phycisphaerae bacterium]
DQEKSTGLRHRAGGGARTAAAGRARGRRTDPGVALPVHRDLGPVQQRRSSGTAAQGVVDRRSCRSRGTAARRGHDPHDCPRRLPGDRPRL